MCRIHSSIGLGATALALVLTAPAYAQTVLNQTAPTSVQTQSNTANLSSAGQTVTSVASQTANNSLNAIGPTTYLAVGGGALPPNYTLQQSANGAAAGDVSQTSNNSISAASTLGTLSRVLAAGNQSGTNTLNVANFAPGAGETGSLTQSIGNAALSATNAMSATATLGTAHVVGSNGTGAGSQAAQAWVNTGTALVDTSTTLTLLQKASAPNTITATNSATATTTTGTTPLDPSVSNLSQGSNVGIAQFGISSAGASNITSLNGAQLSMLDPAVTPAQSTVKVGNIASASATTSGISRIGVNSDGTAGPVTQSTTVGINNISGGPNTSIILSAPDDTSSIIARVASYTPDQGFLQATSNATNGLALTTVNTVNPNLVNTLVASTGTTGSASIQGGSQSFVNQQNSLDTGATLSGNATQSAVGMTQVRTGSPTPPSGFQNSATALISPDSGPANIAGLSQSMTQSLNTASATLGALALTQTASGNAGEVTLGSSNLQSATGTNSATVSGAAQTLTNSVNKADFASVVGGTLTQGASNITLIGANTLTAVASFNASISGSQSATSAVNVVGH